MTRRTFLESAAAAAPLAAAPRRQPNIIFIYADDLDFDEIGCYDITRFPCCTGAQKAGRFQPRRGTPYFKDPRMLTPNIDSLARDGVKFSRFYVTTSICTPSRYSVLTGRYASRSPAFCRTYPAGTQATIQWNTELDPAENNIAREIKKAGYATGLVGKWHCGMEAGYGVRGIPPDADPFDPAVNQKIAAFYNHNREWLQSAYGWDYVERVYFNNKEGLGLPLKMQVHNLEWIAEGALNFIEQNRERPFFLYMPVTIPHAQYNADMVRGNPRFSPTGVLDKAPQVQPPREDVFRRLREAGIDERNAPATWLDDSVGAVLKKLEELNLAGDTLVIFSSDHQSRGKYTCTESCRVPFVARWPNGIKAGTEVNALCANIDLAATFLDLAGATPAESMTQDGGSFAGLLRGQGRPGKWRESLYLECSNIRGVVTQEWKYIANRPPEKARLAIEADALEAIRSGKLRQVSLDGTPNPHPGRLTEGIRYSALADFPHYFDHDQLYNLTRDVFEQDNLAADPSFTGVLGEMKDHLRNRMSTLPHIFGEFKTA